MKRRDFILRSTGAITLPLLFNGLPIKALDGPVLHRLLNAEVPTDRVLVLVQLTGGNDGLNTLVPLDRYETYGGLRPNIAIPENRTLKLTAAAGLHPAMQGIRTLWDDKKVAIVQGVGYPNPNQSHFRSTDIWMSGSDSNVSIASGWIGRYLDGVYAGYPAGYPNETMPDPIAIQMSAVPGLSIVGVDQQSMGIALQDPETFYSLVSGTELSTDDLPATPTARANVEYVREIQSKSNQFSTVIKKAADMAANRAAYPSGNKLAEQLKIVARLIAGGLKTRVYVVQLGGFDTHAAQVDDTDVTIGTHADLLTTLSEAIAAFQDDLERWNVAERVVSMTFSEFGRRPASNFSNGTDHGTAAPVFLFGVPVQDGITGNSPDLEHLDNDNLQMQFDFRQVYASVLQQWFGANPDTIREVLFKDFTTLKVIRDGATTVADDREAFGNVLRTVYPNPVYSIATVRYSLRQSEHVHIQMFDALGFYVATITDTHQDAGEYEVPISMESQPSGTYFLHARIGGAQLVQPFVLVRR